MKTLLIKLAAGLCCFCVCEFGFTESTVIGELQRISAEEIHRLGNYTKAAKNVTYLDFLSHETSGWDACQALIQSSVLDGTPDFPVLSYSAEGANSEGQALAGFYALSIKFSKKRHKKPQKKLSFMESMQDPEWNPFLYKADAKTLAGLLRDGTVKRTGPRPAVFDPVFAIYRTPSATESDRWTPAAMLLTIVFSSSRNHFSMIARGIHSDGTLRQVDDPDMPYQKIIEPYGLFDEETFEKIKDVWIDSEYTNKAIPALHGGIFMYAGEPQRWTLKRVSDVTENTSYIPRYKTPATGFLRAANAVKAEFFLSVGGLLANSTQCNALISH